MATRKRGETLRELVNRMLDETGWSGRETARRAEEKGLALNYNTINEVRNGRRTEVTDATLEGFAGVFGLNVDDVRAAAGVAPRDDSTDPELLRLHASLTPEEKKQALATYRAYVNGLKKLRQS
jgi:hypothetical protein